MSEFLLKPHAPGMIQKTLKCLICDNITEFACPDDNRHYRFVCQCGVEIYNGRITGARDISDVHESFLEELKAL